MIGNVSLVNEMKKMCNICILFKESVLLGVLGNRVSGVLEDCFSRELFAFCYTIAGFIV